MNTRYYDSNTNRFLTPDTIVPDPTNPQTLNRYSYTLNNPIRYSDPSGHCVVEHENDRHNCTPMPPPRLTKASSSQELETWELHALMQAVYSETRNGTYPAEHIEFLAWGYLNRISSGKWSDMGEAVYSDPPLAYIKGVPVFPGSPQSSAGVLWSEVRDVWTVGDLPQLVEERWAINGNSNWDNVEVTVNSVYGDWLKNGGGSSNDPTNGGYFYAALTRLDDNHDGGVTRAQFDALLVEKNESFELHQNNNPGFQWGSTSVHPDSGSFTAFFAANDHCGYWISCGQ